MALARSGFRRGCAGRRRFAGGWAGASAGVTASREPHSPPFQHRDHRALRHLVADLHAQLLHDAGVRGGNFHRRLVAFERDERVFLRDRVAGLHEELDDGNVLEVADVRDLDLDRGHGVPRGRCDAGRRCTWARYVVKRAPSAPSTTRWSYESESGIMRRGANSLPFHTGFIAALETPRIATSGAFTIGVNDVPPMPPSDEIENVPPCMSAGPSLPSRAFAASSEDSCAISHHALLVGVLDHRHHEAVGRVGGEADVPVVLEDEVVAVERAVERRDIS